MPLDILAHSSGFTPATFGEGEVATQACEFGKAPEHVIKEEPQPDAFPFAVLAYTGQTIVSSKRTLVGLTLFAGNASAPITPGTTYVAAGAIYRAAVSMRLDSSSRVERSDVEEAAKDWATRPYGNGNQIGPERVIKRFRLIVCGWLRFAGRLHEPDRAPGPHQAQVDSYCRYME